MIENLEIDWIKKRYSINEQMRSCKYRKKNANKKSTIKKADRKINIS